MAGFKTHISVSTVLGIGYATTALVVFRAPVDSCIVAGGLCSIAGMLPDLDSDSGTPVREMISLISAAVPMLMINRFRHLGWTEEGMATAAIVIYCVMRFGVAAIFKRFTVHRGMWHSIPACAVAGLLTFLIASGEDFNIRAFKACGVVLGFMSHLVVDEIWSFQVGPSGAVRIKRSFGTAIKFWGDSMLGNISVYAKLVIVGLLALGDPVLMERFDLGDHGAPQFARAAMGNVFGKIQKIERRLEGKNWKLVPRDQLSPSLAQDPSVAPLDGGSPLAPQQSVAPATFSEPFTPAGNNPFNTPSDPSQANQPATSVPR